MIIFDFSKMYFLSSDIPPSTYSRITHKLCITKGEIFSQVSCFQYLTQSCDISHIANKSDSQKMILLLKLLTKNQSYRIEMLDIKKIYNFSPSSLGLHKWKCPHQIKRYLQEQAWSLTSKRRTWEMPSRGHQHQNLWNFHLLR